MGTCQSINNDNIAIAVETAIPVNTICEDVKNESDIKQPQPRTAGCHINKPGDVIQYFDGCVWSIGKISVAVDCVMVRDIFTKKLSTFYHDSQAINTPLIHPNSIHRIEGGGGTGKMLGLFGERVLYSHRAYTYLDIPNSEYTGRTQVYRFKNIEPVGKITDVYNLGKKVKLFLILHLTGGVACHNYVYGYVYCIGIDNITIITQLYVKGKIVSIKLIVHHTYFNQIYEVDDDDLTINVGSPVICDGSWRVVADVKGDKIKLSGGNEYIDKNRVELNTFGGELNNLLAANPDTFELGQYLIK